MSPILGIWASQNYSRYSLPTSYESIATVSVGAGGSASVSFTSIPGTYTHLQVRYISRVNTSATQNDMTFNSDTASNYGIHELYGDGSSVGAGGAASFSKIPLGTNLSEANIFTVGVLDILDYANTNKYKTTRNLYGVDKNAAGGIVGITSGLWLSTSAITSITFTPRANTFQQYSHFALYGIKGI